MAVPASMVYSMFYCSIEKITWGFLCFFSGEVQADKGRC